ncbi:MAG: protease modulator HflC [Gammaproteobacteria bacterium]|nr:protease modulator HflC [Gammaproteobacteria bacterium]MDH5594337.1 protease modulator HflC [Gammaproteobacteria bacterium]
MNPVKSLSLIALLGVVLLASFSIFTVNEREKAIKFRLGEIIRDDFTPGLYFQVPFINNVRKFDARIQTLDSGAERYLTKEKKNVDVDSFVKWRIDDVAKFYTSLGGNYARANNRLAQIINDFLRDEFGKRTIQEVVAGERKEIMAILTEKAKKEGGAFGLDIIDVRIKRVDLPREVSNSVYLRMRAERTRVATDLRSKGAEAAERIRADADRQRAIILSEAYRDSEKIKGKGDATSADIYARAYNKNREFYSFHRSLNAYRSTFNNKNDVIVLDADSEFFKYFSGQKQK